MLLFIVVSITAGVALAFNYAPFIEELCGANGGGVVCKRTSSELRQEHGSEHALLENFSNMKECFEKCHENEHKYLPGRCMSCP